MSPSASQVKLLERLDGLRQRISADRFQLAVLGQFKRGKSWATRQNLEDTFRRFSADFDERLALSLVATRGAMATARDRRELQSASVEAEIESTRAVWSRLDEIQTALARI
jgi:hypothetical protein